jgi:hypothetical protein
MTHSPRTNDEILLLGTKHLLEELTNYRQEVRDRHLKRVWFAQGNPLPSSRFLNGLNLLRR